MRRGGPRFIILWTRDLPGSTRRMAVSTTVPLSGQQQNTFVLITVIKHCINTLSVLQPSSRSRRTATKFPHRLWPMTELRYVRVLAICADGHIRCPRRRTVAPAVESGPILYDLMAEIFGEPSSMTKGTGWSPLDNGSKPMVISNFQSRKHLSNDISMGQKRAYLYSVLIKTSNSRRKVTLEAREC